MPPAPALVLVTDPDSVDNFRDGPVVFADDAPACGGVAVMDSFREDPEIAHGNAETPLLAEQSDPLDRRAD